MKSEVWNLGMNHIDPVLVEEHLEQKEKYTKARMRRRLIGWASAACAVLVAVAVVLPWLTLPDVPVWDDAVYTAEDIGALFGGMNMDAISTNAYTKVYVPNSERLPITEMLDNEYLGVYQYDAPRLQIMNTSKFTQRIDDILPKLAASLNIAQPEYEIDAEQYELFAKANTNSHLIMAEMMPELFYFVFSTPSGRGHLVLDDETVLLDQNLSDDEIITALHGVKEKIFDIFDVSFSDVKIVRKYDSYRTDGAAWVYVYFYDQAAHPLNIGLSQSAAENVMHPVSDYIEICFKNQQSASEEEHGNSVLYDASVMYYDFTQKPEDTYRHIADVKKITLEQAEALLYRGYVFGGHSCPLCMAAQDKVSFEGYDHVGLEYIFGYDDADNTRTLGIPFYAFYKQIGTAQNGNIIYAKTYVPAIEISGCEEYFESQSAQHSK